MGTKWLKRFLGTLVLALTAAGVIWLAWPQPLLVDIARISRADMEVTVDDEAKTNIKDIYTVSAPLTGKVLRISQQVGDEVTAAETVVAVMQPLSPAFHDIRSHQELQALLAAADAAVDLAEAELRRIEAALAFSRTELERAKTLARTNTIAVKALDKAKLEVETNEAALASAKAQLDVRRSERASAAIRLGDPSHQPVQEPDPACCVQIRAPVNGRILKIIQESEAVVQAGAPLLELGNPTNLEITAELLSTDAVQVQTGSSVRIDGWGGPTLRGRVTRVDPSGFVKISALGIEEQRVRVTVDLTDPPSVWSRLGNDYRVIVHVAIWSGGNVLTVPVGALFRRGENWAVFKVVEGQARTAEVQIGHRSNRVAEVLSGLADGDQVVLHPSDRVTEGVSVSDREMR